MKTFVLRPRARRDVEEIWDYTVAAWSVAQAETYLRQLQQTLTTLAADPRIGRACDEIRKGYRKHRVGSHIVFYRIADEGIEVVRILHERMDFTRRL